MTVREKLEIEMDKEEIKKLEGENANIEKFHKDTVPDNNDSTDSIRSD